MLVYTVVPKNQRSSSVLPTHFSIYLVRLMFLIFPTYLQFPRITHTTCTFFDFKISPQSKVGNTEIILLLSDDG